MTRKTPMPDRPPMRVIEDHVHFDTEIIRKDSVAPFFLDARRFSDGTRKTRDADTNLRLGGSLSSSPCEKEISSVRIVTPTDMKVRFVFMYGTDPVVDQVLETNVDHVLKRNVGMKMFMDRGLGPLVATECFGVTVTGVDAGPPCRARVEIKGRFTVQDFENPAWAEWHSRLVDEWIQGRHFVKTKAHEIGRGRGDGLFDTEIARPGLTQFFIDPRHFNDETPKAYGATVTFGGSIKDTNFIGNGCSLPRGHVLNVTNVTVEEKELSSGLKEPVKVSIVTAMGHVLASTTAKPSEVTPIGPVWSVGSEDFEVWVEQKTYSGKLRVLLGGEIYKPDMT